MSNCPKCGAEKLAGIGYQCGSYEMCGFGLNQSDQCKQNQKENEMSKHVIDWSKPIRTIADHIPACLTDLKSGSEAYPKVVAWRDGDGNCQCNTFTDSGKYSLIADNCFDLENVPEPKPAKPLTNEQMEQMHGLTVRHRSGKLLTADNTGSGLITLAGQAGVNSLMLFSDYTWPKGKRIDSLHPPTPIDFDSQHLNLEVE